MAILTPEEEQQQMMQSEMYHQQTNPYYQQPQSKVPTSQEFHIYRLNSDDTIQDFIAWLEGKVAKFDKDGSKKYEVVSGPQVNEDGINELTAILSAFLNKIVYLGCIEQERIMIRLNMFMKSLAYVIRLRYEKWGLPKSKRTMLLNQICDLAESAVSRSWDGREADQLSTAISRIEHTQKNETPQQQPMWSPQRLLGRFER